MKYTLGILFAWYIILFFGEEQQKFVFLQLDFSKAHPTPQKATIYIDSFSYDLLRFHFIQKPISLNPDFTYALIDSNRKKHFFRFIYASDDSFGYQLNAVRWINQVPEKLADTMELQAFHIPVKQSNGKTIITLGDEWIYFNQAKYFRHFLAENTRFRFLGNHSDIFGYPMEGNYRLTYQQWDSLTARLPHADYYIIFLDEFCKPYLSVKDLTTYFERMTSNLNRHKPLKIFWINFPLNPGVKDYECHRKINRALEKIHASNLEIIRTDKLFRKNKQQIFLPDGRYLTKQAYKEIAREIKKLMHD